jgi:hypothetical protein
MSGVPALTILIALPALLAVALLLVPARYDTAIRVLALTGTHGCVVNRRTDMRLTAESYTELSGILSDINKKQRIKHSLIIKGKK